MTEEQQRKVPLKNKVCSVLMCLMLVFLICWMVADRNNNEEPIIETTDLWTMTDYSSICMVGKFLGINTANPNTIEVWCAECVESEDGYCVGDLVAYSQNIFEVDIERHTFAETRFVLLDNVRHRDAWFSSVDVERQLADEHCPSGELFGFLGVPDGRNFYCRYGPQIVDMTTGAILAHDFKNFTETTFLLPLDG